MLNFNKPVLTDTVKRFLFWNVAIFLIILLSFNIFILIITNYELTRGLDDKLKHELDNILKTFEVRNDSVVLLSYRELDENDFKYVKESSFFLQIFDAKKNVTIKSENVDNFEAIPLNIYEDQEDYSFYDLSSENEELRAVYRRFRNSEGKLVGHLQLSIFKAGANLILRDVIIFNLLSLPVLFVMIFVASIFLVKKTLSPINEIVQTAEKISAQNLNKRINYSADPADEIGRLRDTLNNLFERLEFQVNQISQFSDHASHQLMNPLTISKTELDYVLRKERNPEDYKNSLELLKDQTEKMIKIINHLLIISKHQDELIQQKTIYNLSKLVDDEINEDCYKVHISSQIEPEIYLRGNSEIFAAVINNLIENAIKYSPADPKVNISLKKNADVVELVVADNGIGISNEDKKKVFERFFRSNKAEELGIKGYGLGLSVVKSVLTQLGGHISIEDNKPQGTKFVIALPAVKFE